MPLNPERVAGGNVELVEGIATIVPPEEGVLRWVPHFATCPNADQHRRS